MNTQLTHPQIARRNDPLGNLNSTQTAQMVAWAESGKSFDQIALLVGAPLPHGFGFTTSKSAVGRFFQKASAQINAQDQAALGPLAAHLTTENEGSLFFNAATQALAARLFELTVTPSASIESIERLSRILENHQRIANLRERTLIARNRVSTSCDWTDRNAIQMKLKAERLLQVTNGVNQNQLPAPASPAPSSNEVQPPSHISQ